MENEFLDIISENTNNLINVSFGLEKLAESFANTGNMSIYNKLGNMAEIIYQAQKNINKAIGREINRQFNESQKQSAFVLNAVLGHALSEAENKIKEFKK